MSEVVTSLAEAAEKLLRGVDEKEVAETCLRVREGIVHTLSDLNTASLKEIVEAYRSVVEEGLEYVAEALLLAGKARGDPALTAMLLCGLGFSDDDCALAVLEKDVSGLKRLMRAGSVVCLPPSVAPLYEAAGIAKILVKDFVYSGRRG